MSRNDQRHLSELQKHVPGVYTASDRKSEQNQFPDKAEFRLVEGGGRVPSKVLPLFLRVEGEVLFDRRSVPPEQHFSFPYRWLGGYPSKKELAELPVSARDLIADFLGIVHEAHFRVTEGVRRSE